MMYKDPYRLCLLRCLPLSMDKTVRPSIVGLWLIIVVGLLTGSTVLANPSPKSVSSSKPSVSDVRVSRRKNGTRLVFEQTGKTTAKVFLLDQPDRVVIDLKGTHLATNLEQLPLAGTSIKNIRHAVRRGNDLRIVLDVNQKVNPKHFLLPQKGNLPFRVVVDLEHQVKRKPSSPPAKVGATLAKKNASPQNTASKKTLPAHKTSGNFSTPTDVVSPNIPAKTQVHPKRPIVIALDAGHGGRDPGALGGPKKTLREKDVVLAITVELAKEIGKTAGFTSKLVRNSDRYVPHRERSGFARKARADLFVSIHADAFTKPQAHGASVFALSQRGSSSETARVLARSQNQNLLLGGNSTLRLGDKAPDLRKVLVDLSMNATLDASLEVGNDVLKEMGKVARLHKKKVEQANFLVLKSTDMPSILIETGFISNPQEARLLSSPSYRRKLAKQIFKGIRTYFERNPPPQSYVEWRQNRGREREVIIARGDTLSGIAVKYEVSVSELRRHNGLKNDTIRIGQRIKIPLG